MVVFVNSIAFILTQHKTNLILIKQNVKLKIAMTSKDSKILNFNQYEKPDKAPFIIYADFDGDGCNPDEVIIIQKVILKIHLQQK